jgi:hypothetical protein
MKLNIKDALYILFLLIALFLVFEFSQNGRYQSVNSVTILDTRSGKMYQANRNGNNKPEGPHYKWVFEFEAIK